MLTRRGLFKRAGAVAAVAAIAAPALDNVPASPPQEPVSPPQEPVSGYALAQKMGAGLPRTGVRGWGDPTPDNPMGVIWHEPYFPAIQPTLEAGWTYESDVERAAARMINASMPVHHDRHLLALDAFSRTDRHTFTINLPAKRAQQGPQLGSYGNWNRHIANRLARG